MGKNGIGHFGPTPVNDASEGRDTIKRRYSPNGRNAKRWNPAPVIPERTGYKKNTLVCSLAKNGLARETDGSLHTTNNWLARAVLDGPNDASRTVGTCLFVCDVLSVGTDPTDVTRHSSPPNGERKRAGNDPSYMDLPYR